MRRATAIVVTLALTALLTTARSASAAQQYQTTADVNLRSGPGTSYSMVGFLPSGATITVVCQQQGGTNVGGNATWDKLDNGAWVSDYYTTSPSFNSYAPGLGPCDSAVTDGATYVSEGAPTDGTMLSPGATFSKRWTIRNSGTSTWSTSSYRATRVSGSYGPTTIGLPVGVGPGANVDISASFTAPTSPGTHRATYQMQGPGGTFGQQFWVEIVVSASDSATFLSESAPFDGASVAPGSTFNKRWTIKNSGSTTWSTGSYQAVRISGPYGPASINLRSGVNPGANVDIYAAVTAPTAGGSYRATYQMRGPGGTFGQQFWVEIVVSASDGATFVSEGAPLDGTSVAPGATFNKRWTVKNSGSTTWSTGSYQAVRISGSYGPASINLPSGVSPGGNIDLQAAFTAPVASGRHRATYQMRGPGGTFGQQFWVEIVVSAGDGATFVSESAPFDGASVAPGSTFNKRWTVKNSGSTTWSTGSYQAVRISGSYGPASINLRSGVNPGANVDIYAAVTAPTAGGRYRATYQMRSSAGTFGDAFWVEIVVSSGDVAIFVSESAPFDGASVAPGSTFNKRWTIKNSGSTTWSTGSYQAVRISGSYGPASINLPFGVSPTGNVDVQAAFTAPTASGRHRATYQMRGPGGAFGQQFWVEIVVSVPCSDCRDLLPELRTMTPQGFTIAFEAAGRVLRFDNEIANGGSGPLEIFPKAEDCNANGNYDDDRVAYQRIYQDSNRDEIFTRSTDLQNRTARVGCMIFHASHNHWHLQDLARYELRRMSNGTLLQPPTKTSICVIDTRRALPGTPGSPTVEHYALQLCKDPDATTGISVGWSDVYDHSLDGQSINITGEPDGDFCFSSTANPGGTLSESNKANNKASTRLKISNNVVTDTRTAC